MRSPHIRPRIHALLFIGVGAAVWLVQAAVALAEGGGTPYPR